MLASYHNLFFINELVKNARAAIEEGVFAEFKKVFLERYSQGAGNDNAP